MSKRTQNTNRAFMIGSMIPAFAVIVVVIFFTLLALHRFRPSDEPVRYTDRYLIEISGELVGDSIAIYLNDSLLMNRTVRTDTLRLSVTRFDETGALMVVDNAGDRVTTFDLSDKGGRILVGKRAGAISITSRAW